MAAAALHATSRRRPREAVDHRDRLGTSANVLEAERGRQLRHVCVACQPKQRVLKNVRLIGLEAEASEEFGFPAPIRMVVAQQVVRDLLYWHDGRIRMW